MKQIITHSPEETIELAGKVAGGLKPGDFISLIGDLGAGKTVFVKGLAKQLGVKEHLYVNSPTFVILKEYHGGMELYHFDVYRLDVKNFCETLDYEKYFYGNGLSIVEWADKIREVLPEEYLEVVIEHQGEDQRKITFKAIGVRYHSIVDKV